ncbi:arsenate reductase ArsC [Pyxidicoccus sp. 3LFB2]
MTPSTPFKVLFLCTGNSARSILAEFLLKRLGGDRFEVHSAGAAPKGEVHPIALRLLRERFRIPATDARSKPWEEFSDVRFDFVITLCDKARESCPVLPYQPVIAHWGSEDPAAVEGSELEKEAAFLRVAMEISRRLELFLALPIEKLDRLRLTALTRGIGEQEPASPLPFQESSR